MRLLGRGRFVMTSGIKFEVRSFGASGNTPAPNEKTRDGVRSMKLWSPSC